MLAADSIKLALPCELMTVEAAMKVKLFKVFSFFFFVLGSSSIAFSNETGIHPQKAAQYIHAVIEANLKPYDILPLIPIITNAGAIVTNWKNEPAENGGNILATSNRKLHNKILKLLRPFIKK